MKPENRIKFQNVGIIVLIAVLFGLVYNFLFYPRTLTEFTEAGSIGLILGLLVGFLEQFVLNNFFKRKPFVIVTVIRSLLYALVVSFSLSAVLAIEISMVENISYASALKSYLLGSQFQRDFTFTIVFVIVMLFGLQVILLIGRENFVGLLSGLYHKPKEIERVFMFVDLNESTNIAESLSNTEYSSFVTDYYYHISDAISIFSGEIYQFVGDEVVVVWPVKRKKPDAIGCFFKMKEIIENEKEKFQSKYGLVPGFKAGIHGGEVVVTTIGKQKKEIVYHGDVLNASSRIQGKCKELGQDLLISEDALNYIKLDPSYKTTSQGKIELRGKEEELTLFGVEKA